jgi:hypothetical protein
VTSETEAPLVVYLCYGPAKENARELRYSVETLLPDIGGDRGRIVVYTDRPQNFADLGVRTVEAGDMLRAARALGYNHLAKPLTQADALRRFQRACVMLDTDGFVRPGFDARVRAALERGGAMNQFVRDDPYPDFVAFEVELPHLGAYRLDRAAALMNNSGLVAARPDHLPLVEDTAFMIGALWKAGLTRHDIDQFCVTETFRLAGVPVALIDDVFEHYCPRWSKRYMRRRLRRRAPGQRIPFSKTRVRLFKAYWNLRLAMRKARRVLTRGAKWRSP